LLTEGLLLAAVPIVGSFIAYLYEFGYVGYFRVPPSFIQLDVTRILAATAVIVISATVYLAILASVADVAMGRNPIIRSLGRSLLFAFFWLPFLLLVPDTPSTWLSLAVLAAVPLFGELLPPLFKRGTGLRYMERLTESEEVYRANRDRSFKTIGQAFGAVILVPVGGILFASFLVVLLGNSWARNQTTFWALADQPDAIMIAHYGDVALFKRVDITSKSVTDELLIYKLSSSAPLRLKQIEIGQLKVPKKVP